MLVNRITSPLFKFKRCENLKSHIILVQVRKRDLCIYCRYFSEQPSGIARDKRGSVCGVWEWNRNAVCKQRSSWTSEEVQVGNVIMCYTSLNKTLKAL